ncbi:hypothetical protein ABID16_002105 [Rhizobium aquaticum]|uniref:Ribbon-helix-helix CopG family protein n=1 Tax=Rhizobium aquaticum TaxID=1549636 RepID=A0ABV2IZ57_9HYPH
MLDLDPAQIEALDRLAETENVSREALVLEAIETLLKARTKERFAKCFNVWGPDSPDGLEFQEQIRREWH